MSYSDLRGFLAQLEGAGELKRIAAEVSPRLEITEISDRVLRAGGPALLFERPAGHRIPVLANLFGSVRRIAAAMGVADASGLREIGQLLAHLKEPEPPKGLRDLWDKFPLFRQVLNMAPRMRSGAPCQEIVLEGKDVDPAALPENGPGGKGRPPRAPAGPDVLARRRGSANHLGPYRDARPDQAAPEPGHLSAASARPEPRHHALARPPRRRPGFPGPPGGEPRNALSGRRGARGRSRHHACRGDAGAGRT